MIHPNNYPGNSRHQALLEAIVSFYQGEARVRAVLLFGSLARGDWDDVSDIDLDIILSDGVTFDVHHELHRLCAAFAPLGESPALILPDSEDAGDIVLESLMQLSIRYHTLETTKEAILAHLLILAGDLDEATIRAAGESNRQPLDPSQVPAALLDRCVYYLPVAAVALRRGYFWDTVEILHRLRNHLLQIYVRTHDGARAYHFFDRQAPGELSDLLKATLPKDTLASLYPALIQFLTLLEFHLDSLSNGQLCLSQGQRKIIAAVRAAIQ
jgi:hypothetical protein